MKANALLFHWRLILLLYTMALVQLNLNFPHPCAYIHINTCFLHVKFKMWHVYTFLVACRFVIWLNTHTILEMHKQIYHDEHTCSLMASTWCTTWISSLRALVSSSTTRNMPDMYNTNKLFTSATRT